MDNEDLHRIQCIYCGNTLSLNYYLRHLKTKKHINTKKRLIDESLLFMPKDVNGIIFEYWDNTPLEIERYRRIKRENLDRIIQIRQEERRQLIIANKWYNLYPRKIKRFIHRLFNPYD